MSLTLPTSWSPMAFQGDDLRTLLLNTLVRTSVAYCPEQRRVFALFEQTILPWQRYGSKSPYHPQRVQPRVVYWNVTDETSSTDTKIIERFLSHIYAEALYTLETVISSGLSCDFVETNKAV